MMRLRQLLGLFDKAYGPVLSKTKLYSKQSDWQLTELLKDLIAEFNLYERGEFLQYSGGVLPKQIAKKIFTSPDFKNRYHHKKQLDKEISGLPLNTDLGKYLSQLLEKRKKANSKKMRADLSSQLKSIHEELLNLSDQIEILKFELISKRKGLAKVRAIKNNKNVQGRVTKKRSFYVKNGYEYWPFNGEYWLDELGNYHYEGEDQCNSFGDQSNVY